MRRAAARGLKAVLNHKLRTVSLFTVTFLSFLYWSTQGNGDKSWSHPLPVMVKCPLLPPFKPLPSSKDIYFLETSEGTNPSSNLMCAVESATRVHPESRIFVLMKGLAHRNGTVPKHLRNSLLGCFPNVELKPLDLNELFSDTPLADWYLVARQRWEPFFLPILSDAGRIALMWKFGGIYLDSDFIVLKNLNNFTNVLGLESKYLLNGAFLSFEPKHKFIELCIQDFVANYNRWVWGHQGPQLVTRIFKRWCSINSLPNSRGCRGVSILTEEAFYPIPWQESYRYFEVAKASEIPKLFKDTYAAHIWNTRTKGRKPEIDSLLAHLQASHCPTTYRLRNWFP